jgi:hypothetical protein
VEGERVAVFDEAGEGEPAADVAALWPLDLDHPGTEVAEPHGSHRTREELAEIEHEKAVERKRCGHFSPSSE